MSTQFQYCSLLFYLIYKQAKQHRQHCMATALETALEPPAACLQRGQAEEWSDPHYRQAADPAQAQAGF